MSFFVEAQFPGHPQCWMNVCAKCFRPADGERVLNTGISADISDIGFTGILYLCESCVCEWGRAFGQVDAQRAEDLRVLLFERNEQVRHLEAKLEAYEKLDSLVRAHAAELSSASAALEPPTGGSPSTPPPAGSTLKREAAK